MTRALYVTTLLGYLTVLATSGCLCEDKAQRGPPPDGANAPITDTNLEARIHIRSNSPRFDGSVDSAKRLYSVLGANIGVDKPVPNWRDLPLQVSDFEKLEGYSLANQTLAQREHGQDGNT